MRAAVHLGQRQSPLRGISVWGAFSGLSVTQYLLNTRKAVRDLAEQANDELLLVALRSEREIVIELGHKAS